MSSKSSEKPSYDSKHFRDAFNQFEKMYSMSGQYGGDKNLVELLITILSNFPKSCKGLSKPTTRDELGCSNESQRETLNRLYAQVEYLIMSNPTGDFEAHCSVVDSFTRRLQQHHIRLP